MNLSIKSKKWSNFFGWSAYLCIICVFGSGLLLPHGELLTFKILGLLFIIVSLSLIIYPFYSLKNNGKVQKGKPYYDTTEIVNSDVYKIVRHPQYLGYSFISLGYSLVTVNWITIMFACAGFICLYLQAYAEEKILVDKFGIKYIEYMEKTPRFNIFLGIIRQLRQKK